MHQFRVTKYNLDLRNEPGHYLVDEWTSFGDISKMFAVKVLNLADYEQVESDYIQSATEFLLEAGISDLSVNGLESHAGYSGAPADLVEPLKEFYCELLGPKEGFRPGFSVGGYWLYAGDEAFFRKA